MMSNTKRDTIDMAREAGMNVHFASTHKTYLAAFEALVRADEREAMVAEAAKRGWAMKNDDPFEDAVREITDARARSQP